MRQIIHVYYFLIIILLDNFLSYGEVIPTEKETKEALHIVGKFLKNEDGSNWLAGLATGRSTPLTTDELMKEIINSTKSDEETKIAATTVRLALEEQKRSGNATETIELDGWKDLIDNVENQDDIICLYRKNSNVSSERSEDWRKFLKNVSPGYTIYLALDMGQKYVLCLKKIDIIDAINNTTINETIPESTTVPVKLNDTETDVDNSTIDLEELRANIGSRRSLNSLESDERCEKYQSDESSDSDEINKFMGIRRTLSPVYSNDYQTSNCNRPIIYILPPNYGFPFEGYPNLGVTQPSMMQHQRLQQLQQFQLLQLQLQQQQQQQLHQQQLQQQQQAVPGFYEYPVLPDGNRNRAGAGYTLATRPVESYNLFPQYHPANPLPDFVNYPANFYQDYDKKYSNMPSSKLNSFTPTLQSVPSLNTNANNNANANINLQSMNRAAKPTINPSNQVKPKNEAKLRVFTESPSLKKPLKNNNNININQDNIKRQRNWIYPKTQIPKNYLPQLNGIRGQPQPQQNRRINRLNAQRSNVPMGYIPKNPTTLLYPQNYPNTYPKIPMNYFVPNKLLNNNYNQNNFGVLKTSTTSLPLVNQNNLLTRLMNSRNSINSGDNDCNLKNSICCSNPCNQPIVIKLEVENLENKNIHANLVSPKNPSLPIIIGGRSLSSDDSYQERSDDNNYSDVINNNDDIHSDSSSVSDNVENY